MRIPRDLPQRVGRDEGFEVEISVEDEAVKRAGECLEDVAARISDADRHDETEWGETQGGEIW